MDDRRMAGEGAMKAAVWNNSGPLDIQDRPAPEPRPGWVRVPTRIRTEDAR
jgi:hypothetical protein